VNKLVKDGKVAVLYTPMSIVGWYTRHGDDRLVFDPTLATLVLNDATVEEINTYCKQHYSEYSNLRGTDSLEVEWVSIGKRFVIREYDGSEWIEEEDDIFWLTA
jgi:hypothetical protein